MRKKVCTQVVQLTQLILEHYWQGDLEPLKEHLHKDILWIGSMDEEYVHGEEAMLQRIDENQDAMPPVFLDQQEYGVVQNEGNTCVIAGRYRAFTKPECGMLLSEKQRVTFVWEKVKEEGEERLLIKHLHLSNVFRLQEENERFPTKAGKENYEYMMRIMAERSRDEVVAVKDENLVNRIINYSDIMYIVSEDNYIRLFLSRYQGNVRVRGNLSDIMKKTPENFVKVSRSIGVNRSYVKSVQSREIVMLDDRTFQIPAAAAVEVKHAILQK